jgi:hypothetical protein
VDLIEAVDRPRNGTSMVAMNCADRQVASLISTVDMRHDCSCAEEALALYTPIHLRAGWRPEDVGKAGPGALGLGYKREP